MSFSRINYFLLPCLFLCATFCLAQSRNEDYWLTFDQDSVYLGRLDREQSPIKQTYRFRVGEKFPIRITEVKADCACITTSFPKEELFPGQYGEISVTFSPYRAGPFDKEFIVSLEGKKETTSLKLTGYLEAFYPSPSLEYPIVKGDLRFRTRKVHLGKVSKGKTFKKEFEIYNASNEMLYFADSVSVPSHIQIAFPEQRRIKAKSSAFITIYYDSDKKADYGYLIDTVTLYAEKPSFQTLNLELTAFVLPKAAQPSPEGNLPSLKVMGDSLKLGTMYSLDQEIVSFQLQNTGNAPLEIKKVEGQPGCEVLTVQSNVVPPLGSVNLNAIITDNGETGKQQRTISLFTNDPKSPYRPIRVFFQLKKK